MDSLLEKLSNFDVTPHANNPNAEHPHYALYKTKRSGSSQEERRKGILEARKDARYDLLIHLRNIEENLEDGNESTSEEDMNVDEPKAVYKKPKKYRNFLMLSEWMVDVPEEFEDKYFALPCPVGKRCLCISYKGWTRIFAKNGCCIQQFPSHLPGGSYKTKRYGVTMLDCIWSEINHTFYILDLISWYRSSYIECETSFRFEWLKSRINEFDEDVTVLSPTNKYKFIPLPFYKCDKDSLTSMYVDPLVTDLDLDGILFYHKDSHYTHGPSPLICWLKPFMLADILGVCGVPPKYLKERPPNYSNITDHIETYNNERKEIFKQRKNRHKKEKMEVCPLSAE